MAADGGNSGFNGTVASVTAVVALLTAVLTLYIKWDDWFEAETRCVISGRAFYDLTADSGTAATGVRLGWAPDRSSVYPGGPDPSLQELATVGPDGAFSGDCSVADDAEGSFELLYTGTTGSIGLPCLSVGYSGMRLSNPGVHEDLNVRVVPQC